MLYHCQNNMQIVIHLYMTAYTVDKAMKVPVQHAGCIEMRSDVAAVICCKCTTIIVTYACFSFL